MLTFIITNDERTYTLDLLVSIDSSGELLINDSSTYKGEVFDENFDYTELDADM